jgi:hypothetical protein
LRASGIALLASLLLASCAVGVTDNGAGDPGTYPEAGPVEASPADGKADAWHAPEGSTSETGSGNADGGGGTETGSTGDGGASGDTGNAPETSTQGDTGSSTCAGHGTTGALVTFDLSSQSGSEASVTATTVATGVTSNALTRASGMTAVSGSGSINSSGWGTGSSADASKYYTFTVTPGSGCTVALTSVAMSVSASGTGPSTGDVATSADSFGAHTSSFTTSGSPTVTLSSVSGTGAIEVRVYGYGASGSSGTFRISSTLTVSGTIE